MHATTKALNRNVFIAHGCAVVIAGGILQASVSPKFSNEIVLFPICLCRISGHRIFHEVRLGHALLLVLPATCSTLVDCRSYDVQACNGMAGTALGRLGPLPVEIVSYIFEDTTLEDALALGMAHGQLFVIGYPPIISKLRSTHPSSLTNWSCDRVICLSDSASSLPASYLSLPERLRLMNWAIKHRKVMWRDPPLDKINRELEAKELSEIEAQEIKRKLGAYKDQSFALFQYGCSMPSIRSLERSARWDPYPFTWRRHGKLDTQRIDVLEREVLRFDPYEYDHNTLMFVNFTKREYVRAVDGEGNDVLYAAIPLLAGWGDDESIRGEWAGDRLGVVTRDAFEDRVRRDSDGQWVEKVGKWEFDLEYD